MARVSGRAHAGIAMRASWWASIRPLALGATRKIVQDVTSTSPGTGITEWERYREPLHATLKRTIGIALVGGAVLSRRWGGLAWLPLATVVMLWPTLGGHFLELWFLNWLRPRLPRERGTQIAARVTVWFLGGVVLWFAMQLTVAVTTGKPLAPRAPWWAGGVAFIGVELVAHLMLLLRGLSSVYDGRG